MNTILLPGDVLLYKASSLYGRIIAIKTWHPISHVECYIGAGHSVASRDGVGTGQYPVRLSDLAVVCRPPASFNVVQALHWFAAQPHRPYGWLELVNFVGIALQKKGVVCSPFVTEFLRAGGFDPFNGDLADNIAPFQFEDVDEMRKIPIEAGAPPEVAA